MAHLLEGFDEDCSAALAVVLEEERLCTLAVPVMEQVFRLVWAMGREPLVQLRWRFYERGEVSWPRVYTFVARVKLARQLEPDRSLAATIAELLCNQGAAPAAASVYVELARVPQA